LANLKQSIKRIRQNNRRRIINKINLSIVKNCIKKFLKSLNNNDCSLSLNSYRVMISRIDKSVVKGIFHRNKANRLKSRLTIRLKKVIGM
jgi:small subunit ribosomal protein S20